MEKKNDIRKVQNKILEIMKYIDLICRENGIKYFIMGGTALGAIRHGGFIPWDDDLDIFMTPDEYKKFKEVFFKKNNDKYILQEWKTTPEYLEYSKVRMNGTTFIEEAFKNDKELHQGIYVDIMILHKVPKNNIIQKIIYYKSKFVTLYALSQRNWKPKTFFQKIVLNSLKFLPCKYLVRKFYKHIYKYDNMKENFMYCYWITPAKFKNGLFESEYFKDTIDIKFEDTMLLGSKNIKDYLKYRYGNYMKLPSKKEQQEAVHALMYDTEKDYKEYMR